MNPVIKTFKYGNHTVSLETGRIARQATGAVLVKVGETSVLATVVLGPPKESLNFLPLTVQYQERFYASGRIPGSFFRREGRPSEKETLTSRLIDRPIRPLFPREFRNEVQLICTVLSAGEEIDPDILAMIGASASLAIAGAPCRGPIGAARVGFSEEHGYILNPSQAELEKSALNMVVAGTADAVLMVESEASELSEDHMLGAVLFAHQEMQSLIEAIRDLAATAGRPPLEWQAPQPDEALDATLQEKFGAKVTESYQITDKQQRREALEAIRQEAEQSLASGEEEGGEKPPVGEAFARLEKNIVRHRILEGQPRIDGRDCRTVRPISIEISPLQRTHGSSLFTRGETQALCVVTLGNTRDAQIVDGLQGRLDDNFMLHYNFPPYSVGESSRLGPPGRREIGHGRLARRALAAMLPSLEDFPYTVRVVSEITESNGSSSMATVCGSSLALMDAGVPLRAPVAGIAMGLVKEGERFAVLTDILGDEDHLGDMDFKVAGTAVGITALQMDIKIGGVTEAIMQKALEQAREARLHILENMNQTIEQPRSTVSEHAPSIEVVRVPVDKIRDVIGKGGATIRSLTEETGTDIDIDQDGTVRIYGVNRAAVRNAMERIEALTAEVEVGRIYEGNVVRITDFGAFISILPGKDGLLHISQIAHERVNQVSDYLTEGQRVSAKVINVDEMGRVKLSMKDLPQGEQQDTVS